MSLVVPSITGGSSDIKIAQREIIQLEDVVESISMTLMPDGGTREMTLMHVNYAFSTYLDANRKLIEASVYVEDSDRWIKNWIKSDIRPLLIEFNIPSTSDLSVEGLSLSFTLPPEVGSYPEAYISIITQPLQNNIPFFICFPYPLEADTSAFPQEAIYYTLTFSLLSTT